MKNKPVDYRIMHFVRNGFQVQGLFVYSRKWSWKHFRFVPKAMQWKAIDAQGNTGTKAEGTYYRSQLMAWNAMKRVRQINSIQ